MVLYYIDNKYEFVCVRLKKYVYNKVCLEFFVIFSFVYTFEIIHIVTTIRPWRISLDKRN